MTLDTEPLNVERLLVIVVVRLNIVYSSALLARDRGDRR